jgi:hypothetical protein
VILELLAERICQARKPTKAHANAEILASTLDVQMRLGSGLPTHGTTSVETTSAGE